MIIKGKSRGSPAQLARHLLRTDTNETVRIVQLDSPTGSLREAFRDWQLISTGTQGSLGLYHANISPDARYAMTPEQWQRAVDVLEKELGFDGQPRAVVVHEKHDRQHIHVVWQRTDIDTMKMIPDSFNYVAHERASLALEKEFGHEIVPGKHAKRDREQQPEFPNAEISHAEWQQAERAGRDPHAFKDAITAIYKSCDTAPAFQAALGEHDLMLAKGDRRDYVLVDTDGQIYSLSRQIKGVPPKDLRAFMAGIDKSTVPTIEQAKVMQEQRERAPDKAPATNVETAQPPALTKEEEAAALERALRERHAEEARTLRQRQDAEYQQNARVLRDEAREKFAHFDALQQAAKERFVRETYRAETGFKAFIETIKETISPKILAEKAQARAESVAAFKRQQEQDRKKRVTELDAERAADLAELNERHQQQQREHDARYDAERDRYLREHEAAAKLRAEIEERRRQEEQQRLEREKNRDGPPGRAR